jgi:DNA-directed RNA polymerase specialized sigma24 family protein
MSGPTGHHFADLLVAALCFAPVRSGGASRAASAALEPIRLRTAEKSRVTAGPGRGRWVLSQDAFWALLSSLDSDPRRAGEKYEVLRRRLIILFLGRGSREPEDGADETLDRLSRRLAQGDQIQDVGRFACGIARRVHAEDLRRVRRHRRLREGLVGSGGLPTPAIDSEAGIECIRRCLDRLDAGDRALIVEYYEGSGRELQEDRKAQADRLGLTPTALRLRSYRLRRALESCTRECLHWRGTVGGRPGGEPR